MEEWKEVSGFNGRYLVSSYGNVKTMIDRCGRKGTLLNGYINNYGYRVVKLRRYENAKVEHCLVHRLVAMAFLPSPSRARIEVDHIDGNPLNCNAENLRWVTGAENKKFAAIRNGKKYASGPIIVYTPDGVRSDFDYARQAEKFFGILKGEIAQALREGKQFIHGLFVTRAEHNAKFPSIEELIKMRAYKELAARIPKGTVTEIPTPAIDERELKKISSSIRCSLYNIGAKHVSVITDKKNNSLIISFR